MKKTLAIIALAATCHTAFGQGSFASPINTTTLTTNSYTLQYLLTVTGQFTNLQAVTWNTNYQIVGDAPPLPSYKINAGFSNAMAWAVAQSNLLSRISLNFVVLSNNVILVSNRSVSLSNAWSAFMATNIPGEPQFQYFLSTNTVVADFYQFMATNVPGGAAATMNFDGGTITSDGSGNATFISVFAQQLKDSGGSTGSSGNYAQANGSGGWYWTAWPATLNFDSSDITSDGSGNVTAHSFKGGLLDDASSSGLATYVPTANGDGTWTWSAGVNQGILYPSNTWNLNTITSTMPNRSFWLGNSNGLAMVSVFLSNGVVRIKQTAP